ncbi:hypothetical protein HELRODRAFT_166712 [Helobdella robusta]|uniref:Uncharacterized protein n=1 Tax=Helobdella robusta TaxID=6412 RepID=T1EYE8_HELRO|nr:hypothetical protein HELRODRAFT_166712 [Helobdella robusta]ESO11697.1 hypothetical protein HELRODRAFT_166712 [Helobdella robusta]
METLEPSGIAAHEGKRPDGCTLIPWRAGRCLAWDVTVPGTFAERYVQLTSKESGLAATRASDEKIKKYDRALPSMEFLPICIEVLCPMDRNTSGWIIRGPKLWNDLTMDGQSHLPLKGFKLCAKDAVMTYGRAN